MTRPGARTRVLRTTLAVVGVAAVQAALVARTAPLSTPPAAVVAAAVASFLACVAGLVVLLDDAGRVAAAAGSAGAAAADPARVPADDPTGTSSSTSVGAPTLRRALLFSLAATAVVVGAAILSVIAGAVAIIVALAFVPVVTSSLRETAQAWRRRPIRGILRVLVTAVAIAVAAVVAMLLGLFITGWPASALAWLWFGMTAALLIPWWSASTHPRPNASPVRHTP